ncbi:MAG: aspartate/glutamate racemase family protein [Candidatus Thorarchaeota archaeon]
MKRIALIGVTGINWWKSDKKQRFVQALAPEGYEIANFFCNYGTHSVESHADEAYNSPFILEQVVAASSQGFDGMVLDCACDPVLGAAREVTSVPVVGPMQASLHLALALGRKFGIITVEGASLAKCMESKVRSEGLDAFFVDSRAIEVPVLQIAQKQREAEDDLIESSKLLISEGADVIVLGCTALSHEVDLERIMTATNVPVIDPLVIGIGTVVMLIESNLSHSKVAYPTPPRKPIVEAPCLKESFDDILRE